MSYFSQKTHIDNLALDLLDYALKHGHWLGTRLKKKRLDGLILQSQIGAQLTFSEKEVLKEKCIELNNGCYLQKLKEKNQVN